MRGINEDDCLKKLGLFCNCIFEPQSRFSPLDGICDRYVCEIKQRNVKKDAYPTTIIGKNKIDYWKKHFPDRPLYFFVRFQDGDFYYIWDNADDIPVEQGGLREAPRDYYFVPKELLIPF